ncbi:MAG TPA: hypothetical protein VNQ77_05825 [Frankiaceae bacterium]|nr:hypothetical protein [Frankiaceae bacterium]
MRRTLAVAATAATLLVVPLAGSAAATGCAATSGPALYRYGTGSIAGRGTFGCDEAATGMTVTVCVEQSHDVQAETWTPLGCVTTTELEAVDEVSAVAEIGVPVYATWLRTSTTGVNDTGATATSVSLPVWWFNCACYIG